MKKVSLILTGLIICFCFSSCKKDIGVPIPSIPMHSPDQFSQDEYDIYTAIILDKTPGIAAVVVQETMGNLYNDTSYFQSISNSFLAKNSSMDTSIFDSLIKTNKAVYYLDNQFEVPDIRVHLIADKEAFDLINNYDAGTSNNYLSMKFPGCHGYLTFSRPGINSSTYEAIVDVSQICGSLCGSGYFYYLKKVNGKWIIIDKLSTWIS